MVEAYHRLHELGHAHSIEVWREDELVGGMYGVAREHYFVASPCSAGWKMRPKRRFWSSVMNLSVMAVNLSTAVSLTITQHRLVPAKFPPGLP